MASTSPTLYSVATTKVSLLCFSFLAGGSAVCDILRCTTGRIKRGAKIGCGSGRDVRLGGGEGRGSTGPHCPPPVPTPMFTVYFVITAWGEGVGVNTMPVWWFRLAIWRMLVFIHSKGNAIHIHCKDGWWQLGCMHEASFSTFVRHSHKYKSIANVNIPSMKWSLRTNL